MRGYSVAMAAFHPTKASWLYSSVGGGAAAGRHGDASRVVNTLLDWPLVTRCFCRHLFWALAHFSLGSIVQTSRVDIAKKGRLEGS